MTESTLKKRIYNQLPYFIQNILVSIEGKRINRSRYNNNYRKRLYNAKERLYYSNSELEKYQNFRLKEILNISNSSPFWREIFNKYDVNINSKDLINELKKMPLLTKGKAKKLSKDIVPPLFHEKLLNIKTSGTTGSSLHFYKTIDAEQEQWAIWWRYREWHGIDQDTLCGYFGGKIIVPLNNKKPPYWRINKPGKQVMYSSYHINKKSAQYYIDSINSYGIKWLHGYPSTISLLAGYIIELGLKTPKVKIITIGAEGIQPHQKLIIEKAFGANVLQHYGLAEGVANISECINGKLHVDEDFSLVEFIPTEHENLYKMVGTTLTNNAFPLLRYDTSDLVTIDDNSYCNCGNIGRVVSGIDGRKDDYVILSNGNKVARLGFIFQTNNYIKEAQIIQKNIGKIQISVVPIDGYFENEEERLLLEQARKWLGKKIEIDIDYVDHIEKTQTGKLRLVISELDR